MDNLVRSSPNEYESRAAMKTQSRKDEETEDCRWALGLIGISLDILGLRPHEDSFSITTPFKYRLLVIMGFTIAMVMLPQSYALNLVISKLVLVVDNISTLSPSIIGLIKLFILWRNRSKIHTLLQEATDDWLAKKTSWERSVMRKHAGRARIFIIIGLFMTNFCAVGYCAFPFFGFSFHTLNNITDPAMDRGRFFSAQLAFPFDAYKSPIFELLYFGYIIGVWGNLIAFTLPESLFSTLVFHVGAQYEILGAKMENLFNDIGEVESENNKILFQKRLRRVVDRHVRLIGLIRRTESTFNMIILAHVLGLTMAGCCFGFVIIISVQSSESDMPSIRLLLNAGAMLSLMFEIFIYCVASEVLAHHKENCSDHMYSSLWYTASLDCTKRIIPIMICSNISIRLTAGGFVDLSMNLFLRISKSIFSYISVLLAVRN